VDLATLRQLELVGNFANMLQDLIRPKVLEAQFVIYTALHRLLNVWLEFDVDPTTNLELSFWPVLIFLTFHSILCTCKVVLDELNHKRPFLQPFFEVRNSACITEYYAEMARWVAI
jgi:hypothetical protein